MADDFILNWTLRHHDLAHPNPLSTKTRGALANRRVLPPDRLFDKLFCYNLAATRRKQAARRKREAKAPLWCCCCAHSDTFLSFWVATRRWLLTEQYNDVH